MEKLSDTHGAAVACMSIRTKKSIRTQKYPDGNWRDGPVTQLDDGNVFRKCQLKQVVILITYYKKIYLNKQYPFKYFILGKHLTVKKYIVWLKYVFYFHFFCLFFIVVATCTESFGNSINKIPDNAQCVVSVCYQEIIRTWIVDNPIYTTSVVVCDENNGNLYLRKAILGETLYAFWDDSWYEGF